MNTHTLPFEIKSITDAGVIEGIISAFGKVDAYGDMIAPGAYKKSLAKLERSGRKLPLLFQHDASRPIGVWTELKETGTGLHGRAELAMQVKDASDAHALAKMGALTGLSIGYNIPAGGARREGKTQILSEVDLVEASLVTFPADAHARVNAVKSIGDPSDLETLLREAGVSGRKAKAAASAAWKIINTGESDRAERLIADAFKQHSARLAAIGGN